MFNRFFSIKKSYLGKLFLALVGIFCIQTSHANTVLIENDNAFVSASAIFQTAFFTQSNSWFGKDKENLGLSSNSWWEASIEPGIKAHYTLPLNSQLFSELSYYYAQTVNDDPSGLTLGLNNPGKGHFEQAYIGWRSGKLFSSADNLLEISFGQQDYKLGHGFLLWGSGSSGYKNGAYWLGSRHAFADSAVLKVNTNNFKVDTFRLKSRPQSGYAKDIRGINIEYLENQSYTLGATYLKIKQKQNSSLDGASILDIRLDINQLSLLPGLSLLAEYVKEDNGSALNSYGWYSSFSMLFKEVIWQPQLTYRYAGLQGDNPNTLKNEAFNPLTFGFSDWGTWFQGEIIGEYVLGNSNLNSHLLRLKAKPIPDLSLNVLYFRFELDQPQSRGITSKHFADEIDFIVDYAINKSTSLSTVLAAAIPGDGATEMTGGDDNWLMGMLYVYYKF